MEITCLILDDSEAKREWMHHLVARQCPHWKLLMATTTEEAMAHVKSGPIFTALIDYEVPTENGPAVIAAVRERNPRAQIACVSSSGNDEYRKNALEAGANGYVCTSELPQEVERQMKLMLAEWQVQI